MIARMYSIYTWATHTGEIPAVSECMGNCGLRSGKGAVAYNEI